MNDVPNGYLRLDGKLYKVIETDELHAIILADLWHHIGNVKVTVRNLIGEVVEESEGHNGIVDTGKNFVRDALRGVLTSNVSQIKYVALGSSSTAFNAAQTTLVSEQFRKAVTQQTAPSTGKVTTIGYISPSEANSFTINELGWFAGSAASATPNSGVMLARFLYTRTKVNTESLQISRDDTF